MQTRKGQIFSSDIVISLVIFLFLATICFYFWERTYDKSTYFSEQTLMKERIFQITDLMVRTSGYPSDWNSNNVRIIGFSSQDHILQSNKINELQNMSDEFLRQKLRVKDYNILLNITAGDFSFTKGAVWNLNATSVLAETRAVLINDSNTFKRGNLRLFLWK